MSMECHVPTRTAYRNLLHDLLRWEVTVEPGPPQQLGAGEPAYLATYRFDDGTVALAVVLELSLATALAGALDTQPPQRTARRVELAGELLDELLDPLREVCNVAGRLHNSVHTAHVVLDDVVPVPGPVRRDVVELVRSPGLRHDWSVEVAGYGRGLLTMLR